MLEINPSQQKQQAVMQEPVEPEKSHSVYPEPSVFGGKDSKMDEGDTLEFLAKEEDNTKLLFYFTVVIAVLVLGVIGYLYFNKSTKMSELDSMQKQYEALNAQLKKPEFVSIEKTASRYSGGLKTLNTLILNTLEYSKVLSAFEKITPNEVVLQNLSFDENNAIQISANANSLDDSAKFVKAIKNAKFITAVTLNNTAVSSDEEKTIYAVSLSASLLPEMLQQKEEVTNEGI